MTKVRTLAGILGRSTVASTGGSGGGGATSYDSAGAFPSSGNTAGDLAFATNKKALYNWDGAEWDRVYSGPNETLTWDSALSSTQYIFNGQQRQIDIADSSNLSITVAANADFEGFPVTYSYQTVPADPAQLDSAAFGGNGISQSGGTFTLRCSRRDSDEGSFTFRAKATDGTHVITSSQTVQLAFAGNMVFNATDNASVATTSSFPQTNVLVATIGGNTGGSMMWGTTNPISELLPTGKRYFEFRFKGSSARYVPGLSGYGRGTSTVDYIGFWQINGSSQGHSGPALTALNNTIVMFAYDTATREVWYGQNGTWVNATPGVGAGSTEIAALPDGSFYFGVCSGSSSGAIIDAEFFTGANINYTKPTGFMHI
tara:strand:+ start:2710 stop:3825 length:1116 start_codon:yes stop_codon:yes gene_type:complete